MFLFCDEEEMPVFERRSAASSPKVKRRLSSLLLLSSLIALTLLFFYPDKENSAQATSALSPLAVQAADQQEAQSDRASLDSESLVESLEDGTLPSDIAYAIPPRPERVEVKLSKDGRINLKTLPAFSGVYDGKVVAVSQRNDLVVFGLHPTLQNFTRDLVNKTRAPHIAVVAMQPHSGSVLAIAEKSARLRNPALHAGYPAASIFKLVTAAAGLENGLVQANSRIPFRGGIYVLERWNYMPDRKRDRRWMGLSEALGKSCNSVFGRVGNMLTAQQLDHYARSFGFNSHIDFDLPLAISSARIPADMYEKSRTAAGFGAVSLSPIHAAALMSGLANSGLIPKPTLVERIVTPKSTLIFKKEPKVLGRMLKANTAYTILGMMRYTTMVGTSRKEFAYRRKALISASQVAAKTGTLRGDDPEGITNWFLAAAPIDNPKIAVAVVVVDGHGASTRASRLGRMVLEKYLAG